MIRNLASYRKGDRLIIARSDYPEIYIEVEVMAKAPKMLKIKARDDVWWKPGDER